MTNNHLDHLRFDTEGPTPPHKTIIFKGKCSSFGGPFDQGVRPNAGLALFEPHDIELWPDLFLPVQPKYTKGLARRLNPEAFYLACRWNYKETSREFLRGHKAKVINLKTGASALAQPIDWGPNEKTGRAVDLSPGLMKRLGLVTDDQVEVII